METSYNTKEGFAKRFKKMAVTGAIVYAIVSSVYMNTVPDLTGHVSSDIKTGRTKPTKLDKLLVDKIFGVKL